MSRGAEGRFADRSLWSTRVRGANPPEAPRVDAIAHATGLEVEVDELGRRGVTNEADGRPLGQDLSAPHAVGGAIEVAEEEQIVAVQLASRTTCRVTTVLP